jgi:hypothetical protein
VVCPLGDALGRAYAAVHRRGLLRDPARVHAGWGADGHQSPRITAVPRAFELGTTWVLYAHRSVILPTRREPTASVFTLLWPSNFIVRGELTLSTVFSLAGTNGIGQTTTAHER